MKKTIKFSLFFKNFFYVTFGNVFAQLMNFLVTIYMARKFGPADFGIINFTNILVTYFYAASCMGLPGLGLIEVNKKFKSMKKTVDNILSLRIIISVIVFLLLIIVTLLIRRNIVYKMMIIINGLTLLAASFYLDWVFSGLQEMKYNSISVIIKNLVYSILLIIVLYFNIYDSIYIVPISLTIGTAIASVYLLRVYLKKYKLGFNFSVSKKEAKYFLGNSWPFYFNGLFALINLNMDTILLEILKGDYYVGLYNSVYRIASALILCIGFIYIPLYPIIIKSFNEGKSQLLSKIINKLRKLIITISVPLAAGSIILKNQAMITIYGKEYAKAGNTFMILMLYTSLLFIREIYGYELNSWGLQKKYMKSVMISAFYNIVSNLIIIPFFGIEGAALNTLISEIINYTMMKHYSREKIKIKYENKYILKILISTAVMASVIIILKAVTLNAVYLAALGAAAYGCLVFGLKVFTLSEIKGMMIRK